MGITPRSVAAEELHHGPAVIRAWAPWCSSCRALAPVVEEVAARSDVPVVGLQVEADPGMVEDLGIRSVPTLVAMRDGAEIDRLVGVQSRDAVESLFELAAGRTTRVRRRAAASLLAARSIAAAAILTAGLISGSVVLIAVGLALASWAVIGLDRR